MIETVAEVFDLARRLGTPDEEAGDLIYKHGIPEAGAILTERLARIERAQAIATPKVEVATVPASVAVVEVPRITGIRSVATLGLNKRYEAVLKTIHVMARGKKYRRIQASYGRIGQAAGVGRDTVRCAMKYLATVGLIVVLKWPERIAYGRTRVKWSIGLYQIPPLEELDGRLIKARIADNPVTVANPKEAERLRKIRQNPRPRTAPDSACDSASDVRVSKGGNA